MANCLRLMTLCWTRRCTWSPIYLPQELLESKNRAELEKQPRRSLQFRTNARAIVWKGKCCRKFCNSKKTQKLEEEKGGEGCNQWQTCWWGTAEGHWFDNDRTKGGSLVAVKVTEEDNVICVPPNIPLLLYLKLCSLTLALGLKVLFTTNVLADNLNVSQVISFSPLGHI